MGDVKARAHVHVNLILPSYASRWTLNLSYVNMRGDSHFVSADLVFAEHLIFSLLPLICPFTCMSEL